MTKTEVLKAYFGSEGYPPVTSKELLAFRSDMAGYRELAEGAARELGVEIEEPQKK